MKFKKIAGTIALWLVIIGAVNWGLIGLLDFNLVTKILGETIYATGIYILVGIAGAWKAIDFFL